MFCQNCGKEIADNAAMCAQCGAPTPNAANANNTAQPAYQQPVQQYQQPQAQQQYQQPYQQPGQYQQPYQQQYYQQPYQQPVNPDEPANGGIIALAILIPIVGIILGCVNMSDGRKKAGKTYLIAALITIGVYVLIGIIIGIAFASSAPYYYYY